MASAKQIAANRRNAKKSTGPRTAAGKTRASRNALRHGLTRRLFGAEVARDVEALAREIAGGNTSAMPSGREAAEAALELDRVRRIKLALIEHVAALGRLEPAPIFRAPLDEAAWIMLHYWGVKLWPSRPKFAVDPLLAMPTEEPARTAEAVRRALPELVRLDRYERRAAARRDRAIRTLMQNEPNFLIAAQTCGSAGNRLVASNADRGAGARGGSGPPRRARSPPPQPL